MVALPPTLAANISATITGTGSNFNKRTNSIVIEVKKAER